MNTSFEWVLSNEMTTSVPSNLTNLYFKMIKVNGVRVQTYSRKVCLLRSDSVWAFPGNSNILAKNIIQNVDMIYTQLYLRKYF